MDRKNDGSPEPALAGLLTLGPAFRPGNRRTTFFLQPALALLN